jgi:hypothetical protein
VELKNLKLGKSLKDACESFLLEGVSQKSNSTYIALTIVVQVGFIELIDDIGAHLEYFKRVRTGYSNAQPSWGVSHF